MWKIVLVVGMSIVAAFAVWLMKKVAPYDRLYPIYAVFVVVLFSLVIIYS